MFPPRALRHPRALLPAALIAAVLGGCTTGMDAAVQSMQALVRPNRAADTIRLDPTFPYLRTTFDGRVGFVWLGNTERNERGPLEVYYSRAGEMLRLQDGRIVSALGFPAEWRATEWPALPSWSAIAQSARPIAFVRARDVMPGYRTGLRDALTLRRTAAPARTQLKGVDAATLTWFEERFEPARASGPATMRSEETLPPARYAVEIANGKETVIYSEQCLARNFCFTWQRWSAQMQQAQQAAR